MKALRFYPHYDLTDYKRWEGDWELIDGVPYDMSPSPKRRHQRLGTMLLSHIDSTLSADGACKNCKAYYELDWIVSEDTVVRPDIMVVCGDFTEDYLRFPPSLVVEILSPQTALKDLTVKQSLYEDQQVPHYLILNPDDGSVKVLSLVDGKYAETGLRAFRLSDDCSLPLDLEGIMAKLD